MIHPKLEECARAVGEARCKVTGGSVALLPSDFAYAEAVLRTLKEPDEGMVEAGRGPMPAEFRYWQEGGMLHAEMRPLNDCVNPATVFTAMISSILPEEKVTEK